jgi:leader peptidase (prepilin peptidase)/N-methyltransferase
MVEGSADAPRGTRLSPAEAALALGGGLAALLLSLGRGLDPPLAFAGALLAAAMLAIAIVDRRSFLVPDWLSLPAVPLGILAAGSLIDPRADAIAPAGHMVGAVVGALSLYLLAIAYRRLRGHEGLGLGDVKLAAAAGAWVGIEPLSHVLLVACAGTLAALAFKKAKEGSRDIASTTALPFGAFLAPAIWIVWAWERGLF